MDNYDVLEVIHYSRTSETIILKVKEKNKMTCDNIYALKLIGSLNNRFQKNANSNNFKVWIYNLLLKLTYFRNNIFYIN